jgi:acyl carrier protein
MADADIAAVVRRFVTETFLFECNSDLGGSQSLLRSGVIDSTGVLELVMFLETTFRMEIGDKDLVPDNLDSIDNIVRFVERCRPTDPSLRRVVA